MSHYRPLIKRCSDATCSCSCCLQATFGPTRSSLADLKTDQGYEEWILRQMSLDARLIVVDWTFRS